MLTSKPRVVLWGVGEHARRNILPALVECEEIQFIGMITRNKLIREEQTSKWQCKSWSSPGEILGSREVDVIYLATPIKTHFKYGMQVLEAGKHLWCEKSLTTTLKDTQTLIEYSESRNLSVCEVCMYLYHSQFKTVQRWLQEGKIGQIYGLIIKFLIPTHPDAAALLETGVYPLSAALQLINSSPIQIGSFLSNDTSGIAYLNFSSGQYACLEWGYGRFYRNELEILGEQGWIFADRIFSKPPSYSPKLILKTQDVVYEELIEPENHFVKMLSSFSKTLMDSVLQQQFRKQALRQAELVFRVMNTGIGN